MGFKAHVDLDKAKEILTDLHPGPRWRAGAPRGDPEGLFPCLPAVSYDSLVGRERHGV